MSMRLISSKFNVLRPLALVWTPENVQDFDTLTLIVVASSLKTGLQYTGPLVTILEYYCREPAGWVAVPCSAWLSIDDVTNEKSVWQLTATLPKPARLKAGHSLTLKFASPPGYANTARVPL